MKSGFTLIEMLVVIGIILVLLGGSITGFSKMAKSAERARAQELVKNVETALTVLYQRDGSWPQKLLNKSGQQLDEETAVVLAKKKLFSLSTGGSGSELKLVGQDRFGIVTPWAAAVIKRSPKNASAESMKIGSATVRDHTLYFAVDKNGDGIIDQSEGMSIPGVEFVRATAAVWSIGKSGGDKGKMWSYSQGRRRDDVYSFTYGQTQK